MDLAVQHGGAGFPATGVTLLSQHLQHLQQQQQQQQQQRQQLWVSTLHDVDYAVLRNCCETMVTTSELQGTVPSTQ
jgi:hypothetical protein